MTKTEYQYNYPELIENSYAFFPRILSFHHAVNFSCKLYGMQMDYITYQRVFSLKLKMHNVIERQNCWRTLNRMSYILFNGFITC